jgi:hypothetical protein
VNELQKVDMASLLVFEPFSHFPQGLKIRVHDESRLDSLGRSVARQGKDGVLVLDLDEVLAKTEEPAAPTAAGSATER